jgi:UDP-N-acetylglucosamine 2-epimerase (non-hydrolysing)
MKEVLFIFGTRPEAIKLAPLIRRMTAVPDGLQPRICVTAQHRGMLDQVLRCFHIQPDYDLDAMSPGQSLAGITSRILAGLDPILETAQPSLVVVQGDTTTTLTGALAAFYRNIPVAHVEAGLRTGDLSQPFPEELNRVITGRLAALHFAPTEKARCHLLAEGTPAEHILVTGNSGIDAMMYVADALRNGTLAPGMWPWLDQRRKLVLVTAHRRESFGDGIQRICTALRRLSERDDVQIAYPVHRNPNVLEPVVRELGGIGNIQLLEPLDYRLFVDLMRRAYILITDSGGIQEEAPSLGKPVLVMRDRTERPEAVEAGTVKLVGTAAERILCEAARLLEDDAEYERMSRIHNPYGDGHSAERIVAAIRDYLDRY